MFYRWILLPTEGAEGKERWRGVVLLFLYESIFSIIILHYSSQCWVSNPAHFRTFDGIIHILFFFCFSPEPLPLASIIYQFIIHYLRYGSVLVTRYLVGEQTSAWLMAEIGKKFLTECIIDIAFSLQPVLFINGTLSSFLSFLLYIVHFLPS